MGNRLQVRFMRDVVPSIVVEYCCSESTTTATAVAFSISSPAWLFFVCALACVSCNGGGRKGSNTFSHVYHESCDLTLTCRLASRATNLPFSQRHAPASTPQRCTDASIANLMSHGPRAQAALQLAPSIQPAAREVPVRSPCVDIRTSAIVCTYCAGTCLHTSDNVGGHVCKVCLSVSAIATGAKSRDALRKELVRQTEFHSRACLPIHARVAECSH